MGIFKIFKRKDKGLHDKQLVLLADYIKQALILGKSEKKIMVQFLKKGYSKELILEAFKLNIKQEVIKMAKKKYDEDEDEEEPEEEDEDLDEDDEEEEKVKPSKKEKVESSEKVKQPTIQDVLVNHEQRLAQIEAKLFRMLSA